MLAPNSSANNVTGGLVLPSNVGVPNFVMGKGILHRLLVRQPVGATAPGGVVVYDATSVANCTLANCVGVFTDDTELSWPILNSLYFAYFDATIGSSSNAATVSASWTDSRQLTA